MTDPNLDKARALCTRYNVMAAKYETQATERYPNIQWKIPTAKPQYVLSGDQEWVEKDKFLVKTTVTLNGLNVGVNTWLEWEQLRDLPRSIVIAAEHIVREVNEWMYSEEPA